MRNLVVRPDIAEVPVIALSDVERLLGLARRHAAVVPLCKAWRAGATSREGIKSPPARGDEMTAALAGFMRVAVRFRAVAFGLVAMAFVRFGECGSSKSERRGASHEDQLYHNRPFWLVHMNENWRATVER